MADRRLPVLAGLLLLVIGCVDATPRPPPPPPFAPPSPSPSPPVRVVPSDAPSSEPLVTPSLTGPLVAEEDGLRLTVELESTTVQPGGTIDITATIENDRDVAVEIGPGWCGSYVDARVSFAVPT